MRRRPIISPTVHEQKVNVVLWIVLGRIGNIDRQGFHARQPNAAIVCFQRGNTFFRFRFRFIHCKLFRPSSFGRSGSPTGSFLRQRSSIHILLSEAQAKTMRIYFSKREFVLGGQVSKVPVDVASPPEWLLSPSSFSRSTAHGK